MEATVVDRELATALAEQYPAMLSLDLRSNSIVEVQDLEPLSCLREIRLDDNNLSVLEGLGSLQHLTYLSVRNNFITQLSDSVTALSSLRVLDLAGNQLSAGRWVSLLASLPALSDLDLRGNTVCELPGSEQLLAAALPGLTRLNGIELPTASPTQAPAEPPHALGADAGAPQGLNPSLLLKHREDHSQQQSLPEPYRSQRHTPALHQQQYEPLGPERDHSALRRNPVRIESWMLDSSMLDDATLGDSPRGMADSNKAATAVPMGGGGHWEQQQGGGLPNRQPQRQTWQPTSWHPQYQQQDAHHQQQQQQLQADHVMPHQSVPIPLPSAPQQQQQQHYQQQQQHTDRMQQAHASASAPLHRDLSMPPLMTYLSASAATATSDHAVQREEVLAAQRDAAEQRAAEAEAAMRSNEAACAQLQVQLQHQAAAAATAAQQAAAANEHAAALAADRDAADARAATLASQLGDMRRQAAEAAAALSQLQLQVGGLHSDKLRLQQELAATQELLLAAQTAAADAAVAAGAAGGYGGVGAAPAADRAAAGAPPAHGRAVAGVPMAEGAGSPDGARGATEWARALQGRVVALQQVVRMQEQELVRLGSLAAQSSQQLPAAHPTHLPTEGANDTQPGAVGASPAAASYGTPSGGWDNVLQPWREQVTALHEQLGRAAAEGAQQRSEWGQKLAEMREQFSQARMLLEVLEQRGREQRCENAQLTAQVSQLTAELRDERQQGVVLDQQLAARDAAAQAVRRQLLAFQAHSEQQAAALELRAQQLDAQAARLSYAGSRLAFALRLAGVGRQGFAGAAGDWRLEGGAGLGRGIGIEPELYVKLQGRLAASPAAKAVAGRAGAGPGPWTPTRGGHQARMSGVTAPSGIVAGGRGDVPENIYGGGGGHGNGGDSNGVLEPCYSLSRPPAGGAVAGGADGGPLVAVLRGELERMARDREVLLKQLAKVSSAAEEHIRSATTWLQEREVRQREALVASRVEAATQALAAEAERKIQVVQAAADARVKQLVQQLQDGVAAAEELARRTEVAAGVRLSRLMVRLRDVTQQVELLRGAQQRTLTQLQTEVRRRQQLEQQLAAQRQTSTELKSQLAQRDSETHVQLAQLRAAHEEALAAERRRAADAERLAAQAAAESGALERQLARLREVRGQQEDARLRRLQTQLHEQEGQLRSLRRERNTLLWELRKQPQGTQPAPPARQDGNLAADEIVKEYELATGALELPNNTLGATKSTRMAGHAVSMPMEGLRESGQAGEKGDKAAVHGHSVTLEELALPLPPPRRLLGVELSFGLAVPSGAGMANAISSGSGIAPDTSRTSISSLIRTVPGGAGVTRPQRLPDTMTLPDTLAPRDVAWSVRHNTRRSSAEAPAAGTVEAGVSLAAGLEAGRGPDGAEAAGERPGSALARLAELEALTAELLSP